MRKFMNIFETIADDFSTNAEIERHLEPLSHEDRVIVRDGLETIKQTGIVGTTREEWIAHMRQLHPLSGEQLHKSFTMMLHLFPFLIKQGMGDSYHWSMTISDDDDIDMGSHTAQLAGMQIRLTGEILNMMKDRGHFTVDEIADQITAVPRSMAVMLVQHVCDTTAGTIIPDGNGYRMVGEDAPKTPSENMSFWRDLAARGVNESAKLKETKRKNQIAPKGKEKKCSACSGSGCYDQVTKSGKSIKCGACGGTGKDSIKEGAGITKKDLPKSGSVVFDLDDGTEVHVEKRGSIYYGDAGSFDFQGDDIEIIHKLNSWGARVVGWG